MEHGKKNNGGKKAKIIIAVPNSWMQLSIMDMLFSIRAREGCIRIKSLPELYGTVKNCPDSIVLIDIFAYGQNYHGIFTALKKANPRLSVICLLSSNEFAYARYFESDSSCYLVEKEKADKMLLSTVEKAMKDQELKSYQLKKPKQLSTSCERTEPVMKEESPNIFKQNIGRRSFLKGSAAAVAAGVAMSSGVNLLPLKADAAEAVGNNEKITYGVCRNDCLGHCPMKVHVRNGRVVKTSKLNHPIPEYERICQRGLTHALKINQSDRMTHPMRRVGPRGSGKWEQITWGEAINEICTKWKQYQKEYGNDSIAYTDCAGNSAVDSRKYYKKLFNLMGSTHMDNSFDNAFLTAIPDTTGWGPWCLGDDERNMLSSKYIFVWGGNITEAGNVHCTFILEAMERGAKLIVIDPNYTIGASKADMYVPIRHGSDAVLAMAMINIAVKEGKTDEDTLMYGTVAPFLVKESDGKFLRLSDLGEVEAGSEEDAIVVRAADGTIGIPADIKKPVINGSFKIQGHNVTTAYDLLLQRVAEWTPERASEICDIPLDTIYKLARMYAEGPTTLVPGYGPDHYANGHCFYYAVTALALVTGQIGKTGAGFNGHGVSIYDNNYLSYDDIINPPGAKPGPEVCATKMPEAIRTGKYGDLDINIKSLFIYNQNMLGNQTNRKAWIGALDKVDLVVVADVVMNDTTMYADIILPVAHFFEVETYDMSYTGVAVYNAKAVEPPGEAIGDFEIATLLGRGMGYEDLFTMTREEFFTEALNNDDAKAAGLDWKSLKEAGYIYTITNNTPIYMQGGNYTYPTPTGRGEFYRENAAPYSDYGQEFDGKYEALPYWVPPAEAWQDKIGGFDRSSLSDKYPLIFTSERPKFKVHTQFSHNKWLLELQPEPTVTFNPRDADARGIKAGDIVKVYNDRGYVVIKAVINPANRPGVVVIDHGWQADEFIEGHYSDLSSNVHNNVIITNAFFDCLVQAVKQ